MSKKGVIRTLIGVSISAVFIWLILQNIQLHEVLLTLGKAHPAYLVLIFVFYLASFIFRTLRWDLMLIRVKGKRFSELFRILISGWGINNILPMRLGEIVRAYFLKIKRGPSFGYALSTIALEKILDGAILILFAGILFLLYPMSQWFTRVSILALIIFAALLLISYIALNWRQRILQLNPVKKISLFLDSVINGLEVLKKGRSLSFVLLYSIIVWLFEVISYYFTAKSLAIEIPIYVIVLSAVAVNLGIMIPSAPGYIGTFEAFAITPLVGFGLDKNIAMAYAIIIHSIQYLTTTLITGGILFKEGVTLREVYRWSENR